MGIVYNMATIDCEKYISEIEIVKKKTTDSDYISILNDIKDHFIHNNQTNSCRKINTAFLDKLDEIFSKKYEKDEKDDKQFLFMEWLSSTSEVFKQLFDKPNGGRKSKKQKKSKKQRKSKKSKKQRKSRKSKNLEDPENKKFI